jgi:hypothetical protein
MPHWEMERYINDESAADEIQPMTDWIMSDAKMAYELLRHMSCRSQDVTRNDMPHWHNERERLNDAAADDNQPHEEEIRTPWSNTPTWLIDAYVSHNEQGAS